MCSCRCQPRIESRRSSPYGGVGARRRPSGRPDCHPRGVAAGAPSALRTRPALRCRHGRRDVCASTVATAALPVRRNGATHGFRARGERRAGVAREEKSVLEATSSRYLNRSAEGRRRSTVLNRTGRRFSRGK